MSNEEQVADTIEMLYQRLNGYNKQDLFNYGYLLESNQILCKDIEEKDKEIERLNNIIDELERDLENFDFTAFICGNRKASKSIELGARLNNDFILEKLRELKKRKNKEKR